MIRQEKEAQTFLDDSCTIHGYQFTSVDTLPVFRCGEKGYNKFLKKNLKDPDETDSLHGKVYVQFMIDEEGEVGNVKVIKSLALSRIYDDEAVRVISMMPKWKPGILRGRKIKVIFNQPFIF